MLRNECMNQVSEITRLPKNKIMRPPSKRAQSSSPAAMRHKAQLLANKGRRCQSLSPSQIEKRSSDRIEFEQSPSAPENFYTEKTCDYKYQQPEKDIVMPHCMLTKTMRTLATKKREFLKLKKSLLSQQNSFIEHYAMLKDLEARAGIADDGLGGIRVLSLKGWPAHDLLLLVRDDLQMPTNSEISGVFGPQVIQQMQAQLNPIPDEVVGMGAELMARRIDLLNLLRGKHRNDRATYSTNLEWKTKNLEFDNESEYLHRMVAGMAENLKAKIVYSLDLAKVPWKDRDTMAKKIERLQKENTMLQHKIDNFLQKNEEDPSKDPNSKLEPSSAQVLSEELAKERAAKKSLKEVVTTAESMLRVARAKIATLEKQLKEARVELEASRRKQKDLEQLYRHRESNYDARSKKLMEVSKTGEIAIDALSRQRDALELRVKELREQAEEAERIAVIREAEQKSRVESLQAKVAEQEKKQKATEERIVEVENYNKNLEEQLKTLRERSLRLADLERRHCLEYIPSKENEPSDKETEIWKELQVTRSALTHAQEELRQSKEDRDSFLNSLSRIAQEQGADKEDKLANELLSREKKILKMQQIIDEQRENEKAMEQSMTDYENQLAALRLEVRRLRNYECSTKELPYQDLQTELLAMHMQVETLTRERSALVNAAASRALMLERHERSADLFVSMTRARRDLVAHLEGRTDPPGVDSDIHDQVSRSLTSVCASAAETWSALRAERARVLRLESAVLSQSLQLEREERVRTQLERRRAILEREILKSKYSDSTDSNNRKQSYIY